MKSLRPICLEHLTKEHTLTIDQINPQIIEISIYQHISLENIQNIHSYRCLLNNSNILEKFTSLFQNITQVYRFFKKILQEDPQNIQITQQFVLILKFKIEIFGESIQQKIQLETERVGTTENQVIFLREKIKHYKKQLTGANQIIKKVIDENKQMKEQLKMLRSQKACLQNMLMFPIKGKTKQKDGQNHQEQFKQENTKTQEEFIKTQKEITKTLIIAKTQSLPSQLSAVTQFEFIVDPACKYYDKFEIKDNLIRSKCDDYFQIHSKSSLEPYGIFEWRVHILSNSNLSIGIMSQHLLEKAYNFQDKNCICLFSYVDEDYCGIYDKGSYIIINNLLKKGSFLEMKVNMNEKYMKFYIDDDQISSVKLEAMFSTSLYPFIQTYEANQIIEIMRN